MMTRLSFFDMVAERGADAVISISSPSVKAFRLVVSACSAHLLAAHKCANTVFMNTVNVHICENPKSRPAERTSLPADAAQLHCRRAA
ncbi:hypothetical protein D3C86_1208680 [compost metagenome]